MSTALDPQGDASVSANEERTSATFNTSLLSNTSVSASLVSVPERFDIYDCIYFYECVKPSKCVVEVDFTD